MKSLFFVKPRVAPLRRGDARAASSVLLADEERWRHGQSTDNLVTVTLLRSVSKAIQAVQPGIRLSERARCSLWHLSASVGPGRLLPLIPGRLARVGARGESAR